MRGGWEARWCIKGITPPIIDDKSRTRGGIRGGTSSANDCGAFVTTRSGVGRGAILAWSGQSSRLPSTVSSRYRRIDWNWGCDPGGISTLGFVQGRHISHLSQYRHGLTIICINTVTRCTLYNVHAQCFPVQFYVGLHSHCIFVSSNKVGDPTFYNKNITVELRYNAFSGSVKLSTLY